MAIIQAYNPDLREKVLTDLFKRRLAKAIETANDDDYSLSQILLDNMCNDDKIRKLLNRCAADHLIGKHPDCFELGKLITKFAADFYENYAADNVEY